MKIAINLLDKSSIDKAIKQVEKMQKKLDERNAELVKRLAEIGQQAAEEAYGPSVRVHPEKTGENQWTIYADGRGVCFIEFGTGVYAEKADIYEDIPFTVAPGSWSNENRAADDPMRYDNWIAAGKSGYDWPYSRVPHPGMLAAYEAIIAKAPEEAKRIFAKW